MGKGICQNAFEKAVISDFCLPLEGKGDREAVDEVSSWGCKSDTSSVSLAADTFPSRGRLRTVKDC